MKSDRQLFQKENNKRSGTPPLALALTFSIPTRDLKRKAPETPSMNTSPDKTEMEENQTF